MPHYLLDMVGSLLSLVIARLVLKCLKRVEGSTHMTLKFIKNLVELTSWQKEIILMRLLAILSLCMIMILKIMLACWGWDRLMREEENLRRHLIIWKKPLNILKVTWIVCSSWEQFIKNWGNLERPRRSLEKSWRRTVAILRLVLKLQLFSVYGKIMIKLRNTSSML